MLSFTSCRTRLLPALALTVALGLTACSSDESGDEATYRRAAPIVVATTNFTETKILAHIYQQVLEKAGSPRRSRSSRPVR